VLDLGLDGRGAPFAEERLLSVAAAYQAVTDFHRVRPPDPSGTPVTALFAAATSVETIQPFDVAIGEDE
jgi:amidase